ncbi:phosphocholine-specific phospholipase C [Nannocystis radixulma]|uniref:phospholipase C n=1 Tax=Nannocystis radixulma TaxID=2995305 RepID=A0ABT5BEV8_9BACT|nr:phospholipase C, phosphocholine-specific [Nannocystis radixulma]MDC0672671.1 phospholipase C, phosphocholine-specific [Nannocystis radixulma]
MTTFDRRTFLRLGGAATGALGLPACIREAMMIPADSEEGSIMDIDHVVILIQENRSFDHYFGTMRGVRGFGDRFTVPVAGAESVWHQRKSGDELVLPYHLDSTRGNAQRVEGPPHGFLDGQLAYDHGRLGAWPEVKGLESMGYYSEQELPFQFALAEAFTVCDAYHCSIHSSTNPNRLFAFTGTNRLPGGPPAIDNDHDTLGDAADGYTWATYAERLEAAGVSWKVYQDLADNFTDNPLVGFKTFRTAVETDPESPLVQKGISTTLTDSDLEGLRRDVLDGTLPSVAWIVGPAAYSEHPGPSSPVQGAYYVQMVLEALIADPAVWSRTALIVTFDENDGFFDHVPPPCAPSGRGDGTFAGASTVDDAGERYDDGGADPFFGPRPLGPGMRVPTLIVSPFSRGGWVCSEVFDHTSILRFLEARFGVEEPNISPYRRAFCGDLTSAFDFAAPNAEPLDLPMRSRAEADRLRDDQEKLAPIAAPVGAAGTLPRQAAGTRPSRKLPYALHVLAEVAPGGVTLRFVNDGFVGAVFHVYDRNDLAALPRRYAVEAGNSLAGEWTSAAAHDLWVLGPNGFHRHFGGAGEPFTVRVIYDLLGQRIRIYCHNHAAAPHTFVITANAYFDAPPTRLTVAAGAKERANFYLRDSGYWYDFTVTVDGAPEFFRRLAGRMEIGVDSISDPALGGG